MQNSIEKFKATSQSIGFLFYCVVLNLMTFELYEN